ncbi:hypothetical protein TPY_0658 [Sulfobacillus acidophilus TPY]|uniref:Uncharacterized protein n=1 Tax=Sulfobacillus acidophilus (strain ATCC 700253 / DSM 10332 / NAL) TaxID=679936 RepID=G8U0A2_SULAD|nr:hypothetical protein TPY_0658 [Sulfobacillus acidophilus TPY]AEW06444.1 hypothetical protein Sulac_2983 [Sulfobacillus acidophilus DSM 10332]
MPTRRWILWGALSLASIAGILWVTQHVTHELAIFSRMFYSG